MLGIPGSKNRRFRALSSKDLEALDAAERTASSLDDEFTLAFDTEIPRTELRRVSVPLYGLTKFHDLLLPRQKLALATLSHVLRRAYESVSLTQDPEVALIALDIAALGISNVLHYNMNLSTYLSNGMISAFIQPFGLSSGPIMHVRIGFIFLANAGFTEGASPFSFALRWLDLPLPDRSMTSLAQCQ